MAALGEGEGEGRPESAVVHRPMATPGKLRRIEGAVMRTRVIGRIDPSLLNIGRECAF